MLIYYIPGMCQGLLLIDRECADNVAAVLPGMWRQRHWIVVLGCVFASEIRGAVESVLGWNQIIDLHALPGLSTARSRNPIININHAILPLKLLHLLLLSSAENLPKITLRRLILLHLLRPFAGRNRLDTLVDCNGHFSQQLLPPPKPFR